MFYKKMAFFGLFGKKEEEEDERLMRMRQGWRGREDEFGRPIGPPNMRPPGMEFPHSLNEAEMHTIISKLDLISARLENLNIRLENLERALQLKTGNPEQFQSSNPQQETYQRRW